jgi:hypothetical protein
MRKKRKTTLDKNHQMSQEGEVPPYVGVTNAREGESCPPASWRGGG